MFLASGLAKTLAVILSGPMMPATKTAEWPILGRIMYSYIARRLIFGALTVIGVSIMVFVIMRILPGDPLVAIFGPEGLTKLTAEQRASYMRDLGLLDPLWVQYLRWAGE